MNFKNPEALSEKFKEQAVELETMIKEHADIIPKPCIRKFYDRFPDMSYILGGGLDELCPIQNKFTDEELMKFTAVLDKHNFKRELVVDSLTNKDLKYAFNRHDYSVGADSKDEPYLAYIIKLSKTPLMERFDKGHYANWYGLQMLVTPKNPNPFPLYKRFETMDALCDFIDTRFGE